MSKTFLILPFLILCAGASCVPTKVIKETEIVYLRPGDALLVKCPARQEVPELFVEDIYTNRDFAIFYGDTCASRVDSILDWYKNNVPKPQAVD